MRTRTFLLLAALPLLLLASVVSVAGQAPSRPLPADSAVTASDGDNLTVWLMTIGPGEAVWERFGHNAIRIRDEATGVDIAYNYGMFSFDQEDFILRFIQGHMDYWMEGFDSQLMVNAYASAGRAIWMQELNLTPEQKVGLRDFLEWNARPENRFYRYDYYRANCSTRVRDAIDRVLDGQIEAQTSGVPSGTTFREHTRELTASDPLVYTGLMAGLGEPVDREISAWEEMFLPMVLRHRIDDLQVVNPSGERVPLVLSEVQVAPASNGSSIEDSPSVILYLFVGLVIGGLVWLSGRQSARGRGWRALFGVLGTTWVALAGTLGVVLLGLWLFTDHVTSYHNENLFFFTPLLVPLIGLIPAVAAGAKRARSLTFWIAALVAAVSIAGFALQVLPSLDQVNGELIALALPANLGLALATWEVWRRSARGG